MITIPAKQVLEQEEMACSCAVPLVTTRDGFVCPSCGMVYPHQDYLPPAPWKTPMFEPIHHNPSSRLWNYKLREALHISIHESEELKRETRWIMALDHACELLQYPESVMNFTWYYFHKIIKRERRVSNGIKLLAACIYSAAREIHSMPSVMNVIDAFNKLGYRFSKRDLLKVYSRYKNYLPKNVANPFKYIFFIIDNVLKRPAIRAWFIKNGRDIDVELPRIITNTQRILKANRHMQGSQAILCAAVVYRVFKYMNLYITARSFEGFITANEATIRGIAGKLAWVPLNDNMR